MTADHVPRPKNAFIFFRSYYIAHPLQYKQHHDQNEVSRAAGIAWRAFTNEEKRPFKDMAEKERLRYLVDFPGYKYGSGGGVKKAKERRLSAGRSVANQPSKRERERARKARKASAARRASFANYTSDDDGDADADADDDDESFVPRSRSLSSTPGLSFEKVSTPPPSPTPSTDSDADSSPAPTTPCDSPTLQSFPAVLSPADELPADVLDDCRAQDGFIFAKEMQDLDCTEWLLPTESGLWEESLDTKLGLDSESMMVEDVKLEFSDPFEACQQYEDPFWPTHSSTSLFPDGPGSVEGLSFAHQALSVTWIKEEEEHM